MSGLNEILIGCRNGLGRCKLCLGHVRVKSGLGADSVDRRGVDKATKRAD